jgi:deoxyribonuclease-4
VGVVLDTAHAWAAGYDLASAQATEKYLARVDATVGLARVQAWHLNDSLHALGSRRDEHTHLGKGLLGRECFGVLVTHPRLAQAPGIMETPKDSAWADRRNLAYLHRLERGRRAKREI